MLLDTTSVPPTAIKDANSVNVGHLCTSENKPLQIIIVVTLLINAVNQVFLHDSMPNVEDKEEYGETNI